MRTQSTRMQIAWSLIAAILMIQACPSFGVAIPPEKRIPWTPGIAGGVPDYAVATDVKDYGVVENGTTDDTQAFRDAISATTKGEL